MLEEEAQGRAQQILNYFPGESPFKKAAYATITGGLLAWLTTSGIYIPNEETVALAGFAVVVRFLYVKLKDPLNSMLESSMAARMERMRAGRRSELETLGAEIRELEQFRDYSNVVSEFYTAQQENLLMESDLSLLLAKNQALSEIKTKLDEAVRNETDRRLAERTERNDRMMAELMEQLSKPEMQDRILKKCLLDFSNMPVPSSQARI